MTCLGELEQKVLCIVQKNKELQKQIDELLFANEQLEETVRQFEASLLKETSAAQVLSQEKAAIKNTIEELLSTINTLDGAR